MEDQEFKEMMKLFSSEVLDADFTEKALRHFKALLDQTKDPDPEKREAAKQKLKEYETQRVKLREGLSKAFQKSEEEIKQVIGNEQNYTHEQWERIQEAMREMKPVIDETQQKKKIKKGKTKKNWIKS